MPKSTFIKIVLFIVAVILGFMVLRGVNLNDKTINIIPTPSPTPKPTVQIGETVIPVEIAETAEDQRVGLGKYSTLPESEGMLFPYTVKSPATYWMKGMSFPIDIIWIADGKVVQITENVPHEPGVPDNKLKFYPANQPVNYVLEVNAGFAERNNIKVGDAFTY